MVFKLGPKATAAGYRLESFAAAGSTNQIALERAAAGEDGPLWLVTARQEAGRGRRGRSWEAPEGNLAATLLLARLPDPSLMATLGFVAGIALAEALERISPSAARFELKWPNDVLADGAKLSGILLESAVLAPGRFALAVGIGVNVASHPQGLPYPATSLAASGAGCDAADLFLALSDAWVDNAQLWDGGRGLVTVRERWLARAAGVGGEVTVRLEGRVVRGIFETIDEECRLVIRLAGGGIVTITAGDVHFGTAASA